MKIDHKMRVIVENNVVQGRRNRGTGVHVPYSWRSRDIACICTPRVDRSNHVKCIHFTAYIHALKIMLVSYRHDFQCDLLCDIVTIWCNLDPI